MWKIKRKLTVYLRLQVHCRAVCTHYRGAIGIWESKTTGKNSLSPITGGKISTNFFQHWMSIFLKLKKTNHSPAVMHYLFCSLLVGEAINRECNASFCVQMQKNRTPRMTDHAYLKRVLFSQCSSCIRVLLLPLFFRKIAFIIFKKNGKLAGILSTLSCACNLT